MTNRSTLAKAMLAAAAGATALAGLAAPSFASAQGYYDGRGYAYDRDGYSYDPCRREKTNRGVAGALIGGALGAVIGSNAAARGVRTEGSLLGGAVGAGVGAAVGNSSAACDNGYERAYDGRYAGQRYESGYSQRDYAPRYDQGYAYEHYGPGRDSYSRDYYPHNRQMGDGCTLAESPIYLPDGRVERRFVRVCEGRDGAYGVVD